MASPESPDSREFRQMRNDVDDVYPLLDGIAKSVTIISATQRRHGNRLEELQQSLDLQSGRMDRLEDNQRQQGERLGRVEGRLDGIDQRLDGVDKRFDGVDKRFDGVNQRFDGVNQRFDGVNQRFDGVDQRFDGVDQRLGRIEDTQQEILTLLRGRSGG